MRITLDIPDGIICGFFNGVCVAEQCEGTITRYQSPQADAQTEAKLYRLVAELFKGSA